MKDSNSFCFLEGELASFWAVSLVANPSSDLRTCDIFDVEFVNLTSDGSEYHIRSGSTSTGIITCPISCPNTPTLARASKLEIVSGSMPQGIASSTVQLTVRSPTNMLLNVSRNAHSQNYVVTGRLMLAGGGLGQQAIKLKVNDTEYNLSTNGTGFFSKSLDLQPNNNQAIRYMISASFSGDSNVKNVTAWSYTLNSTRYAACTTVQYGYGPSTNRTNLLITPWSSESSTSTGSTGQMQQQAESAGWLNLKIWNEFTWWAPWYRLHINATIAGRAWIHAAFNPVLPIFGGEVETHGFETLVPALPSVPTPTFPAPPPGMNVSEELTSLILKEFFAFSVPMAAAIATGNFPALPAAIAGMLLYGIAGAWVISDAYDTYFSNEWGAHTKAFAKFMTLLVTLGAAIIGTELSFSAGMVLKTFVIPTISTFMSNLINPIALQTAINSWWISSFNALFVGLALLKIPNPFLSNSYFKHAFVITNVILLGTIVGLLVGLPI